MRTAVELYYPNFVSQIQATFIRIANIKNELPDRPDGPDDHNLWSCHVFARALKMHLNLDWEVKDGFFDAIGVCHSWFEHSLVPQHPRTGKFVIDVLPMGAYCSAPILVDISSKFSPWANLYREDQDYYKRQTSKWAEIQKDALLLAQIMKERNL